MRDFGLRQDGFLQDSRMIAPAAGLNAHIELLGPALLKRPSIELIDEVQDSLALQVGWHYALDLVWIVDQLESAGLRPGARILDAGGGLGLLQYVLAERGYEVLSVDFAPRKLPVLPRLRYRMRIAPTNEEFDNAYTGHLAALRRTHARHPIRVAKRALVAARALVRALLRPTRSRNRGAITFLRGDISNLPSVESRSFEAVVSLSVLEHIPQTLVTNAIQEMCRVVAPGGLVCVTTSASGDKDWYHEPSKGWCFTEGSLRRLFDVAADTPSWGDFAAAFAAIANDHALPRRMPDVYRFTGDCGMPWGIWNPTYIPVGIAVRTKI